ncbi:MAG: hypothetical protein H0U72_12385 [Nitrosospira sp.]|nr:hypothetical protein [Nitrosospira sp.]
MNKSHTIPDTEEAWESGELGRTEEFAEAAPNDVQAMIDKHLDLQPISIRLEKSLIEDFKLIASMHGIGYQPLMRQILKRFADCEKKQILREVVSRMKAEKKEGAIMKSAHAPVKQRRVA